MPGCIVSLLILCWVDSLGFLIQRQLEQQIIHLIYLILDCLQLTVSDSQVDLKQTLTSPVLAVCLSILHAQLCNKLVGKGQQFESKNQSYLQGIGYNRVRDCHNARNLSLFLYLVLVLNQNMLYFCHLPRMRRMNLLRGYNIIQLFQVCYTLKVFSQSIILRVCPGRRSSSSSSLFIILIFLHK